MRHKAIAMCGTFLCAGMLLAADAAASVDRATGTWDLNNWTSGDTLHLTLKSRSGPSRWQWGSDQLISDLRGLTRDQLHAARASVTFTMVRDAGTFAFDGTVMLGIGRGDFHFIPDPTFALKLSALGYATIGEDDLPNMAIRDISIAYAGEVRRSGLRDVGLQDLVRFRDHGVEGGFLRALKVSGYSDLVADDIIALRDHGVDAPYLEGLADSGLGKRTADDIVTLRDHGIEPAFVRDLLVARPGAYGVDDLVRLREHGVDPRYVARIQAAGFKDLTVDEIVRLREHGVD
jgi:hypothetical protein